MNTKMKQKQKTNEKQNMKNEKQNMKNKKGKT